MTITTKKFKYSALAKIIIPLCSAALIVGCNDDNSSASTTPLNPVSPINPVAPVEPSVSQPTPVELPATIKLPDEAPSPSAEQFVVSYMAKSTSIAVFKSSTPKYSNWTLNCDSIDSISATSSDEFGPIWVVNKDVLDSCSTLEIRDESQSAQSAFSVSQADLGKAFYVAESDAAKKKLKVRVKMDCLQQKGCLRQELM